MRTPAFDITLKINLNDTSSISLRQSVIKWYKVLRFSQHDAYLFSKLTMYIYVERSKNQNGTFFFFYKLTEVIEIVRSWRIVQKKKMK